MKLSYVGGSSIPLSELDRHSKGFRYTTVKFGLKYAVELYT